MIKSNFSFGVESISIFYLLLTLVLRTTALEDECSSNLAAGYPCKRVKLQSFLSKETLDITGQDKKLNDVWGWREYALVGKTDGVAFVDISNPTSPKYVGYLKAHDNKQGVWRDIKTYGDYAYIVADAVDHGIQIFDLRQLSSGSSPKEYQESGHFGLRQDGSRMTSIEFERLYQSYITRVVDLDEPVEERTAASEGYAQSIAINEDTGYAYVAGSSNCAGGLYILNLSNRLDPLPVGCYTTDGPISDAQCINHSGREICFATYTHGVSVVDVSNKSFPERMSFIKDEGTFRFVQQGWVTDDRRYFLFGDRNSGGKTQTYAADVSNLNSISISFTFTNPEINSRPSHQYVKGGYTYQANFKGGLRILDLSRISSGQLSEIAYFDTTSDAGDGMDGAWGVYPFFNSGNVVVSSVNEGLFVLEPNFGSTSRPTMEPKPTKNPSRKPSARPSRRPSAKPSLLEPSSFPSRRPSRRPSRKPSSKPSRRPSGSPRPSSKPSQRPSKRPTISPQPSKQPSVKPSARPTITALPSDEPSVRRSLFEKIWEIITWPFEFYLRVMRGAIDLLLCLFDLECDVFVVI